MTVLRQPVVAGSFYPADPVDLETIVNGYLDEVSGPRTEIVPKALIVPHAGYIYSGPTAGYAFAQMAADAAEIRRVVLLGPAHRVALRGLGLPACDAFATPLGEVPLAVEAARRIASLPQVVDHPAAHQEEHSLEEISLDQGAGIGGAEPHPDLGGQAGGVELGEAGAEVGEPPPRLLAGQAVREEEVADPQGDGRPLARPGRRLCSIQSRL